MEKDINDLKSISEIKKVFKESQKMRDEVNESKSKILSLNDYENYSNDLLIKLNKIKDEIILIDKDYISSNVESNKELLDLQEELEKLNL